MVLRFLAFGGVLALWIHLIHGNPPFVLKKTRPGRSQPRSCKPLLIMRRACATGTNNLFPDEHQRAPRAPQHCSGLFCMGGCLTFS